MKGQNVKSGLYPRQEAQNSSPHLPGSLMHSGTKRRSSMDRAGGGAGMGVLTKCD